MNVAEAVGTALVDLGVTDAFGLIGSGNFTVTNAMVGRGARFVSARHECAAVSMADAYARVSGRVGVATVHQGPGLTNATTALTEAAKARTPLVVVAADVSAGAVRSNFRIDQAGLAAAVGAVHERAHSPESALHDLARAWEHAAVGRRTVLFSLPLDVQAAEAPGASLNMWTTRHGELIGPEARVAQIDVDPDAIGAHRPADLAVIADARLAAEALTAELDRRGHAEQGSRREDIAAAIAAGRWRDIHHDDRSTSDRIDPRTVSKALDAILPAERLVAVDSGHFMGWPPMYLSVPDAAGFVFTQSFQSIGLGLSSAGGAAIARPDRLAVACLGDGGALMAAGEFETLVRLQLPMLVVVYNDAAYGAEVHHFGPQGHNTELVRFPDPDLAGLAQGLGAGAATVRSLEDLAALEKWLERRDEGPFVLDVKVVPDVVAEWLEEAFRAH